MVGRNGVGKSTLLRAVAEQEIQIPDFIFVMHVEQVIMLLLYCCSQVNVRKSREMILLFCKRCYRRIKSVNGW